MELLSAAGLDDDILVRGRESNEMWRTASVFARNSYSLSYSPGACGWVIKFGQNHARSLPSLGFITGMQIRARQKILRHTVVRGIHGV
jgi:hypothetical protein